MKKQTKAWLIVALALMVVGGLIFTAVMFSLNWDFRKLSTVEYETNEYEIHEGFENLSIYTDTADVKILPSENGECKVVCFEPVKYNHATQVEGNTLKIGKKGERWWHDYIGIDFNSASITVYLPAGEYGAFTLKNSTGDMEIAKDFTFATVDINTSTGDIKNFASSTGKMQIKASTGSVRIEDVQSDALDLIVSTGNVTVKNVICSGDMRIDVTTGDAEIKNVSCSNFYADGTTGDLYMVNVIAQDKFNLERTTGDVKFENCDAVELLVDTDTGDVTGTLLTPKVYIVDTDIGNVDVPKTATGGRCEISTNTGDIEISSP